MERGKEMIGKQRNGLIYLLLGLSLSLGACSGDPASMAQSADRQPATSSATGFDAQRALEHLRRLVQMGPRPVGTPAHDNARDYIIDQLKKLEIEVERHDFVADTPIGPRAMTNIIGKLAGSTKDAILIGSHYDTKLFKDFAFVGANDGGSSTGAVLEIARVLAGQPRQTRPRVWFVFFDGEEAFVRWTATDSKYGSRRLARKWFADGTLASIRGLILLDMIGDRHLDIKRDGYSTRSLVDIIWGAARQLGYSDQFQPNTTFMDDDHQPFLRLGVPSVDIIDFNFGPHNSYWHSAADTIDKLDAQSLKIVADVVIQSLPAIMRSLASRGR